MIFINPECVNSFVIKVNLHKNLISDTSKHCIYLLIQKDISTNIFHTEKDDKFGLSCDFGSKQKQFKQYYINNNDVFATPFYAYYNPCIECSISVI